VEGKEELSVLNRRFERMNQPPFFYETRVEWKEGTRGTLRAPDLPTLEVASPPEFGGEESI
jgi:hypothetical protein